MRKLERIGNYKLPPTRKEREEEDSKNKSKKILDHVQNKALLYGGGAGVIYGGTKGYGIANRYFKKNPGKVYSGLEKINRRSNQATKAVTAGLYGGYNGAKGLLIGGGIGASIYGLRKASKYVKRKKEDQARRR